MINHLVNQRYEILEKVGESAFFAVYKARDRAQNRIVAVKAVQPAYAADTDFLTALKTGLNASANLNHPNITRFQEFGIDEGTPYFVVEFVRGINLKERIRRIAPFTLSVAVDFACAIAEALHYAHSMRQAHGDLRPQNIVISPEGALKITDWGTQAAITRAPQAQHELLQRAAPYHAPELSIRQPGTVGGDIYAVGAILYEMLTGTPVYAGDSPEAIAEQHAFAAIPSPRAINPGVPRSIEGIIVKCLQKRPDDRYRAAADLLNDMKSVRDALRFGKPLSWSPIEIEKYSAAPVSVGAPTAGAASATIPVPVPAARVAEPIADVTASSIPVPMPSYNNRLRAADERVSIYIKIAIGTVTALILVILIGFVGVWSSLWVVPKPVTVPRLTGKTIDEVREMAKKMNVRLFEHGEYTDKPRDIVYKSDHDNAQMRAGQVINVWYSRGPAYVNVPNVVNMTQTDAEQKLKDAGLTVGKVMTEFNDHVTMGYVIRQDVSYKKRVFHDTAVGLFVSDGPKPDYASPDNGNPNANPSDANNDTNNGDNNDAANNPDANANPDNPTDTGTPNQVSPPPQPKPQPEEEAHTFDRTVSIPSDGKGIRQVRIEYRDSRGWQPAVIDEVHNEGDKIRVTFFYYGKEITMRIYYDNVKEWDRTFDPQNRKRIR